FSFREIGRVFGERELRALSSSYEENTAARHGILWLQPRNRGSAGAVYPAERRLMGPLCLGRVNERGAWAFLLPFAGRPPHRPPLRNRWFVDSLLEGDGFEPSVPLKGPEW